MPVADHEPPPTLVLLLGQLGYIRVNFGLQGGGQHPPRPLPDDPVDQGPVSRRAVLGDYREHGRTFPAGAANAGLLGDLQSITREGTPFARLPEADPQVLSIAPHAVPGFTARYGKRLRKGLTMLEVAGMVGVSEGYYRKLERGVPGNYSTELLDQLSRVLGLDESRRTHLYAMARGEVPEPLPRPDTTAVDPSLAALVHAQPWPAYTYGLDDWDITSFNAAAAHDYPWMLHGINVQVWALSYPEARMQLCDWEERWCKPMASQLRLQYLATRSPRLTEVIAEISERDPRVGKLIMDDLTTVAHADGDRRWLYRPGDDEPVEVEFLTLERRQRSHQRLMIVRPLNES